MSIGSDLGGLGPQFTPAQVQAPQLRVPSNATTQVGPAVPLAIGGALNRSPVGLESQPGVASPTLRVQSELARQAVGAPTAAQEFQGAPEFGLRPSNLAPGGALSGNFMREEPPPGPPPAPAVAQGNWFQRNVTGAAEWVSGTIQGGAEAVIAGNSYVRNHTGVDIMRTAVAGLPGGASLEMQRQLLERSGQGDRAPTPEGLLRGTSRAMGENVTGLAQAVAHPLDTAAALAQSTRTNSLLDQADPSGRVSQTVASIPLLGPLTNFATNAVVGIGSRAVEAEQTLGPGAGAGSLIGSLIQPGGLARSGAAAVGSTVRRAAIERGGVAAETVARADNLVGRVRETVGRGAEAVRNRFASEEERQLRSAGQQLNASDGVTADQLRAFLAQPENTRALAAADRSGRPLQLPDSVSQNTTMVAEGRESILREFERRQRLDSGDPNYLEARQVQALTRGLLETSEMRTLPQLRETGPGLVVGRSFGANFEAQIRVNRSRHAGPVGGYFSPLESLEGRTAAQLRRDNALPTFNTSDAAIRAFTEGRNLMLASEVRHFESLGGVGARGGGIQLQFQRYLRAGERLDDPSRLPPLRPAITAPIIDSTLPPAPQ